MMSWTKQRGGESSPRRVASAAGRIRRSVVVLAAVATLGAGWFFLAPAKLGGSTDYVVTYGISMQPRFHAGDLAIVRARPDYQVGQIVAYHNLELGRVVLHRIIGRIGDRYVFKGDNNDFVDPYHPTREQLIGSLWLHVPRAGRALSWLASPAHRVLGGAGAAVVVLLLGGGSASRRRRRGSASTVQGKPRIPEWGRLSLGVLLVAALAFALLGVLSYRRPLTKSVSAPGYAQQGVYAYSAHVAPSAIYPSGQITTGQTVFTRIVHKARIDFGYRFVSALPHDVHGTVRLRLALASSLGWTAPLPSPAVRAFSGDSARLEQTLNLGSIETELSGYLARTGIVADTFTLTVTPHVAVHGAVSGQAIDSTFAPTPLTFAVDPHSLRLLQAAATGELPGASAADPLHPGTAGTVARSVPRTIGAVGRSVPVATARRLARLGLLGALAALAALTLAIALVGCRSDEAATIRRRYRDLLVSLPKSPVAAAGYVDVASFEDLLRVAAYEERPVLSSRDDGFDAFYVADGAAIYRYTIRRAADEASGCARAVEAHAFTKVAN